MMSHVREFLLSLYGQSPWNFPDSAQSVEKIRELYLLRRQLVVEEVNDDTAVQLILAINNIVDAWFTVLRERDGYVLSRDLEDLYHDFYDNPYDDEIFFRWLSHTDCSDRIAKKGRDELRCQLEKKILNDNKSGVGDDARSVCMETRSQVWKEEREFLASLGIDPGDGDPLTAYRGLIATIQSSSTRRKLDYAWRRLAAGNWNVVADAFWGERKGSFRSTRPELERRILVDYLAAAKRDVRAFVSVDHVDRNDIVGAPWRIRQKYFPPNNAVFDAGDAVMLIADRLAAELDIRIQVCEKADLEWEFTVSGDHIRSGCTRLIFTDDSRRRYRSNYTQPVRNALNLFGHEFGAVSLMSVRLSREACENMSLSLQNCLSVLHEFGHAVQHMWRKDEPANSSGLERIEGARSESFPLLVEKLLLSDDRFIGAANVSGQTIENYRAVYAWNQRLTALVRAVSALVCFEVHRGDRISYFELLRSVSESTYLGPDVVLEALLDAMAQNSYGCPWRYVIGSVEAATFFSRNVPMVGVVLPSRQMDVDVEAYFMQMRRWSGVNL